MDTETVERIYSTYSRFYDVLFGKWFDRPRALALAKLGLGPGERVLEVGVGTGLSLSLYPRDCHVVGIDLSASMLAKGIDRSRRMGLDHIELCQMDAAEMDFSDDAFDAVFAAYVISAVPYPRRVLAEMSRVCRPGGRVVLVNHFSNGNPIISKLEKRISPFCTRIGFRSDLNLEALLDGSDFEIVNQERVNPLKYWKVVECLNRKGSGALAGTGHRSD